MAKKLKSLGDRLILLIVRHRDRATVRNIARSHLTGAEFEQAKQDCVGLVTWERIYQISHRSRYGAVRRSQTPSLTARLTPAGLWRAARLGVPYDPSLADAVLAESGKPAPFSPAEKELAAEQASYKRDALEYRSQLAARKTAKDAFEKRAPAGPRRKRSAQHYQRLAAFLATRKKLPAFASEAELAAAGKIPSPASVAPPAIDAPQRNHEPSTSRASEHIPGTDARREYFDMLAQQNRIISEIGQPQRMYRPPAADTSSAENERIKERIRKQGYGDAIEGERVWFDNRKISLQEWEKSNP